MLTQPDNLRSLRPLVEAALTKTIPKHEKRAMEALQKVKNARSIDDLKLLFIQPVLNMDFGFWDLASLAVYQQDEILVDELIKNKFEFSKTYENYKVEKPLSPTYEDYKRENPELLHTEEEYRDLKKFEESWAKFLYGSPRNVAKLVSNQEVDAMEGELTKKLKKKLKVYGFRSYHAGYLYNPDHIDWDKSLKIMEKLLSNIRSTWDTDCEIQYIKNLRARSMGPPPSYDEKLIGLINSSSPKPSEIEVDGKMGGLSRYFKHLLSKK